MRLLLQRVKEASVTVSGELVGSISTGLLVLAGFTPGDEHLPGTENWLKMLKKMLALRIFPDADGRFNLSVMDCPCPEEGIGDAPRLLVVPQFTLYADCRKGLRPSFHRAMDPDVARTLYERLLHDLEELAPCLVARGRFGADMDVRLLNWGPVTILLEHDPAQGT